MPGCAGGRARGAQMRDQFAEALSGGEEASGIRKPFDGALGQLDWIGFGLDELGHHHGIGQKVGHGEVLHGDHTASDLVSEPGSAVQREGGNSEPRAFEGHGSGRGERERGLLEGFGQSAHFGFRVAIASGSQRSREVDESRGGEDEPGPDVGAAGMGADAADGFEEDGQVALEFTDTASREQQHFARCDGAGGGRTVGVAVDNGMANELDGQTRRVAGVPILLKGKNGEQEVVGLLHATGSART